MPDPRVETYARLLVERCVDVQSGWQVIVRASPLARPLVEEVSRAVAQRGAYAISRIGFADVDLPWVQEAPESLLGEMAPIERHAVESADAFVSIWAPENTRELSRLEPARLALLRQAFRPALERVISEDVSWVGCQFPCPALAQEAGMSLVEFEDFLYGACLLDWDEEGRKMRGIAERFDEADQVRIVGDGTELTFSLEGRPGRVDDGRVNMPGGEVFYSPLEDSAEGKVTFAEFPAVYDGREIADARLVFSGGRVVEAFARTNEDFLRATLDTDEGARGLGEFGIGCNPGIQRHMKNTLFDEKIYGTVHLALGAGFPFIGGRNVSTLHWDIVKDLRAGGQIYCDGELVQERGEWRF